MSITFIAVMKKRDFIGLDKNLSDSSSVNHAIQKYSIFLMTCLADEVLTSGKVSTEKRTMATMITNILNEVTTFAILLLSGYSRMSHIVSSIILRSPGIPSC